MEAVAPDIHASFSPDRLRSTYAHIPIRNRVSPKGDSDSPQKTPLWLSLLIRTPFRCSDPATTGAEAGV